MRDIKFRAWDKLNKRWIETYYNHVFHIPIKKEIYVLRMIEWDDVSEEGYCYREFTNEQVEITQYTGLHDKNGVEIYEGGYCKNNIKCINW